MGTNDDVLEAVQELTETYQEVETELADMRAQSKEAVPLFKNGVAYWEGYENLSTSDDLYADVLCYGGATKDLYSTSMWNNAFMLKLVGTAFAQPKAGFPEKCHIIRMPLNNKENKMKAIFFKYSNADNYVHGYISAYLCDKNTLKPYKFLGTEAPNKGSGDGKAITFDMFNGASMQTRYHEWLSFNINIDDAENSIDEDDYIYIGFTSTVATFYCSGWGIADRNAKMFWSPSYVMTYASEPVTTKPTYGSSCLNGLAYSYYPRNTELTGIEIPYDEDVTEGLLISFLDAPDGAYYQSNLILKGANTGTKFRQNSFEKGNYGKLLFSGAFDASFLQVVSFILSKEERIANTIEKNGKKYIKLNADKFYAERSFYFCAIYTEEI